MQLCGVHFGLIKKKVEKRGSNVWESWENGGELISSLLLPLLPVYPRPSSRAFSRLPIFYK